MQVSDQRDWRIMHVLTAIGVILILAGVLAIFFGDKQIPVRGGIVLKLLGRRARSQGEEEDFPNWPFKFVFGGALIFGGVMMVLKVAKVI
jgi:hypothetical protein